MDENQGSFYEDDFLNKLTTVTRELSKLIDQNMGVRIGQSTVCSQKMHISHPSKPQEVNVMQDMDAGQIFYHRKEPGRIYHLDVFHECGLVEHHIVARQVCKAVDDYNIHYAALHHMDSTNGLVDINFFDIQTGTGGGRVTGNLTYGQKLSLRKIHTNHVHLTTALLKQHLACLVYVIMAIENAILSCALELRCNEKIENIKSSDKGKIDLSAYAEKSDSLLQENNSTSEFDPYQKNQETNNFMDTLETSQEVKEFLRRKDDSEDLHEGRSGINSLHPALSVSKDGIINLQEENRNIRQLSKQIKSEWEDYLPDIEIHLRRVMRRVKKKFLKSGQSKIVQNRNHCPNHQSIANQMKDSNESKEIEISQTIQAVARRMIEEETTLFKIDYKDLRYTINKKQVRIEFCVLVDASSSMKGQRIRAAKLLAKFLFFSTADRMSIIAFQGNKSWVQVPFTRDIRQLEQGLENIKASGETPLALGLTACIHYFQKNRVYNPLIILITDGVPTLGMLTIDPIYDALQVARSIKFKNYSFTCIGLKPHLDYLKQLARVAGGTIYVVEDLEKEGMC